GTVHGIFRRLSSGDGIVRPSVAEHHPTGDVSVASYNARDASTGDEVVVQLLRKPRRDEQSVGEVVEILQRATQTFVGTYFVRDGSCFVRVDGTVFSHSIAVGDPGAKGARPGDKVVIDLLKFPKPEERGEGVIVEVLGRPDDPRIDTLSVVRALGIPDDFSLEA